MAGVIGTKKFSYDLWGETVNTASRMEMLGFAGHILVTEDTYEKLRHRYQFGLQRTVEVKGKGEVCTYLLTGRNTSVGPEDRRFVTSREFAEPQVVR